MSAVSYTLYKEKLNFGTRSLWQYIGHFYGYYFLLRRQTFSCTGPDCSGGTKHGELW